MMKLHGLGCVGLLLALLGSPALGDDPTEPFVVNVPGRGWRILLQSPPLSNYAGQTKDDVFVFQAAGAGGFNVSAFVEPPAGDRKGHEACFDHYWPMAKRNPMIDQSSVKVVKSETFVKVSYVIKPPGRANGNANRHVNYYMAHEGRWVDVHASQSPPREGEDKLFEAFEAGLAVKPTRAAP